jgi:hypothetical protein
MLYRPAKWAADNAGGPGAPKAREVVDVVTAAIIESTWYLKTLDEEIVVLRQLEGLMIKNGGQTEEEEGKPPPLPLWFLELRTIVGFEFITDKQWFQGPPQDEGGSGQGVQQGTDQPQNEHDGLRAGVAAFKTRRDASQKRRKALEATYANVDAQMKAAKAAAVDYEAAEVRNCSCDVVMFVW